MNDRVRQRPALIAAALFAGVLLCFPVLAQSLIDPDQVEAYRQMIPADFNRDGEVTRADADALIALIQFPELREELEPRLTEQQLFVLGDINNDARLDGRDHELMLSILGGERDPRDLDIPSPRRYERPHEFAAAGSQPALIGAAPAMENGFEEEAEPDQFQPPLMGDVDQDQRISVYDVLLLAQLIRHEPGDIDVADDEQPGTPVVRQAELLDFNANGIAEVGDLEMWRNRLFVPTRLDQPSPHAPRLRPGPGGDQAPVVEPVQMETGFGADAVAIARWNVVPYQAFAGEFAIGVLAFHVNGIERVDFSVNGGPWTSVTSTRWDPRTGVESYWVVLDADDFDAHEVTVRAIAYPTTGLPRELKPLELIANYDGSLQMPPIYVRSDGNDENPGTLLEPVRTMTRAFALVQDGGQIIMNRAGIYRMPDYRDVSWVDRPKLDPTRWITVRGAEGLSRRQLVVRQRERSPLRPHLDKIRWRGISFNFHFITSYYPENDHLVWFDTCRWFNSAGRNELYDKIMSTVRVAAGSEGAFVTDTTCEDMLYGMTSLYFIRNCRVERVGADALTNSSFIVNTQLTDHQRPPNYASYHSDVLQYHGYHDNVIVHNVTATSIYDVQGIFFNRNNSGFRNMAFVNVLIDTTQEINDPPFSQLASENRHILFRNVMLPNQRLLLRQDFRPDQSYDAQNVLFEGCQFTAATYAQLVTSPPRGVRFVACFVGENRGGE